MVHHPVKETVWRASCLPQMPSPQAQTTHQDLVDLMDLCYLNYRDEICYIIKLKAVNEYL